MICGNLCHILENKIYSFLFYFVRFGIKIRFFVWNSIPNNFYFKLFLMRGIFLAVSSPKLNLHSCFCTLLFFKDGKLSSHLAPLRGKINICARRFFGTKFNFEQLLFKAFLRQCIYLAASSPKLNLLPRFCTLLFFKDGNLSSPLAPL